LLHSLGRYRSSISSWSILSRYGETRTAAAVILLSGAFQFSLELGLARSHNPEDVAVLTARAKEFKFALAIRPKDKICEGFRLAGEVDNFCRFLIFVQE
jgi:hypothetical protein